MNNKRLKFRVWDIKSKYFLPLDQCMDYYFYLSPSEEIQMFWDGNPVEMEDYIIHQFTGLMDKHGTEIFDGDIVQYNQNSSYNGLNFVVVWNEEKCGWEFKSNCGEVLENVRTHLGKRWSLVEVVGNCLEKE